MGQAPVAHEAADIFPLDEEHIAELSVDIKAFGLRNPIELLDGRVIDGRRRLKACGMAKVAPRFKTVEVTDPVSYVMSLNLHRRHLTPSQLAMVAARARSLYDEQAKARQVRKPADSVVENLPPQKARDAAGKAVGVSGRTVDFATRVIEHGTPELVQAVDQGRIAVSTAAVIAADPPDAQRAHVAQLSKRKYRPTRGGSEFGGKTKRETASLEPAQPIGKSRGVGVQKANEAVDCLKRIPKNDPLRARGFQIVTDWIRQNR